MPVVDSKEDLVALKSLWGEVRRDLLRVKRLIDEEIRSYPTPIPRCDAQFNHLHDQRARLARELDRIGALDARALDHGDFVRLIGEFVASQPYADDAPERKLRSRLRVELSAFEK